MWNMTCKVLRAYDLLNSTSLVYFLLVCSNLSDLTDFVAREHCSPLLCSGCIRFSLFPPFVILYAGPTTARFVSIVTEFYTITLADLF